MAFFLFSALALALPASRTAVVQLGAYPGYVPPGQTTSLVGGTLAIEQVAGSAMITVKGYLTGLELSSTSGWHIHEGFTCSDSTLVRGHYFPGMATDPWNAVSWQSDFRGVAPISFSIAQFTLDGINPVMGRTVVVHDTATNARVACGVIQPLSGELVEFSRYPEYPGSSQILGLLAVSTAANGALHIAGTLTGLAVGTGGWHVHSGYSCNASGPHYFEAGELDPWVPVQYSADATGVANISLTMAGFSLVDWMAVVGRTIVVHDPAALNSERAACGPIGVPQMGVAQMGAYPDTNEPIGGTLRVVYDDVAEELIIDGVVTGLTPSTQSGWHVHAGYTCEVAAEVLGHLLLPDSTDPWAPLAFAADANGVAKIHARVKDFTLGGNMHFAGVLGRAIVFHEGTARVGCGIIESVNGEAVSLGAYPSYTGTNQVGGLVVVQSNQPRGVGIYGTLVGLATQETGGWHIHTGYTCATATPANVIGGHYFPGMNPDPWLETNYASNAQGVATIAANVPNNLGGTLAIEYVPHMDVLVIRGLLTGLNASTSGGWHVHSGFSCASALEADTWKPMRYTADSRGVASIYAVVPGFSLGGAMPVAGRAIVVHNSFGSRVGCGLITPVYGGKTVSLGTYPEYAGGSSVRGLLVFGGATQGPLSVHGVLTGLPTSSTGGWHVHAGSTCAEAAGVKGHYFEGMVPDPWTQVTYTTDERGVASINSETSPTLVPLLQGFTLSAARAIDGLAVVVHDPDSPRSGCGVTGSDDVSSPATLTANLINSGTLGIGASAPGVVNTLQAYVSALSADFIDVSIVGMREAHPIFVVLTTFLLVAAGTVFLCPGIIMALMLGYGWTYAYGGTLGVSLGTATFFCATLVGALVCHILGSLAACTTCVSKCPIPSCLLPTFEALADEPFKLLVLLRASPIVPFNLLNYYTGACGRFQLKHVLVGHLFTLPMSFCMVGVGGAILKWRRIDRNEISDEQYAPFIWAGFAVTLVFVLGATVSFIMYARRQAKGPVMTTSRGPPISADGVAMQPKRNPYSTVEVAAGGQGPPPPPGPPPPSGGPPLKPGWRELQSDEGETYYFNDDTGEALWEPPYADGAPPPPGPPPSGQSDFGIAD